MIFSSTIISEKERERTLMAETICEASKPRSHKLTRGLSILRRRLLSSCNHNDDNYYQDQWAHQWGGSSNNDLDNGKPERKVILSNVEASRVEFVNSSVVAVKPGFCRHFRYFVNCCLNF